MNQKGFINILVIIVVVVLAITTGYFVLKQQSKIPPVPSTKPQPSTKQDADPVIEASNEPQSVLKAWMSCGEKGDLECACQYFSKKACTFFKNKTIGRDYSGIYKSIGVTSTKLNNEEIYVGNDGIKRWRYKIITNSSFSTIYFIQENGQFKISQFD